MNRANGTGTYPAQTATMAADFEDTTEPEAHVVITNATLHRLMMRLNQKVSWLAAGLFTMAGALVLFAMLMWWARPR